MKLHELVNGELYEAIEWRMAQKKNDDDLIKEVNRRGFANLDSFGSESGYPFFGKWQTHAEYVEHLKKNDLFEESDIEGLDV